MAIKALLFDVFGTLVDWRTGVAREVGAALKPDYPHLDVFAFADAWRAHYQPSMEPIRRGVAPFAVLDVLHRRSLDAVLESMGLTAVPAATRDALALAWHRLDAWPDAREGLAQLRTLGFRLAPCSNGNVALMEALARRNAFAWDCILGAEAARDYKPAARVYTTAVASLKLQSHEVMMVAAHSADLHAASALGLHTAFVARRDEHGPGQGECEPCTAVDLCASNLLELAPQLARFKLRQ